MNFEEVKRQEQENLMPTYGRFPVALVYGKGAVAVDTEGKEYIDFTSGIGVNSLGYCDDGWVSAVAKQAGAIQHMSNLYYSPVQTSLAAELCRLTGLAGCFSAIPEPRPMNALLSWPENTAPINTANRGQRSSRW